MKDYMAKVGTIFEINGKLLMAEKYDKDMLMWICRDFGTSERSYALDEEVYFNDIKIKERTEKDMKLEYKFYEKNLAPKWLEGDYDLHIEGNKMVMTSKLKVNEGKNAVSVETRCHPDDDWRLQVGIDELKERMAEAKKPREIKVGDKVKFVGHSFYNPNKLCDFFDTAKVATYDIMKTMSTALSGETLSKVLRYEVLYVGDHLDRSINKNVRVALVKHEKTDTEFVVQLEKLELVE